MKQKELFSLCCGVAAMTALILDCSTALSGAANGIELCLRSVIPTLFPFLVLSIFLTGQLSAMKISCLRPIGKLLYMPENTEIIFLLGLLGGYPMGAQCIRQAYDAGKLSRADAQRMLCFCSNAGPAFLFGIGMMLFENLRHCWMVWGIHIFSAILIGMFVPAETPRVTTSTPSQRTTITEAVRNAANVMIMICSWIVLFRILLTFLGKWLARLLPGSVFIFLCGLLELTNGCDLLMSVPSLQHRIIIFSIFLGFGGFCVALQTNAVLAGSDLSIKSYFLGKLAQSVISCILGCVLFSVELYGYRCLCLITMAVILVVAFLFCRKKEIVVAFRKRIVYTENKSPGGITYEAFSQKG